MSDQERPIKDIPNYHGHPNYFFIFLTLIGLMIATIILGFFEHNPTAVLVVWLIAVFKAYLVMFKFMHLSWEPKIVFGWIAIAVVSLCCFIAGTYVDVLQPQEPINILGMQPNSPGKAELIKYPKGWELPASAQKDAHHKAGAHH